MAENDNDIGQPQVNAITEEPAGATVDQVRGILQRTKRLANDADELFFDLQALASFADNTDFATQLTDQIAEGEGLRAQWVLDLFTGMAALGPVIEQYRPIFQRCRG